MRNLFGDRDPDPEGVLVMIWNHARLAGWFGNPRQEYADAEAEGRSIDGYAAGVKDREARNAAEAAKRAA